MKTAAKTPAQKLKRLYVDALFFYSEIETLPPSRFQAFAAVKAFDLAAHLKKWIMEKPPDETAKKNKIHTPAA